MERHVNHKRLPNNIFLNIKQEEASWWDDYDIDLRGLPRNVRIQQSLAHDCTETITQAVKATPHVHLKSTYNTV
jgi:hypothetical protein